LPSAPCSPDENADWSATTHARCCEPWERTANEPRRNAARRLPCPAPSLGFPPDLSVISARRTGLEPAASGVTGAQRGHPRSPAPPSPRSSTAAAWLRRSESERRPWIGSGAKVARCSELATRPASRSSDARPGSAAGGNSDRRRPEPSEPLACVAPRLLALQPQCRPFARELITAMPCK
jgi:hypothetical protein